MAACLLGQRVRFLPVAWMFVCCECWVCCTGTGPCNGPITRPGHFYQSVCVCVCVCVEGDGGSDCDQVQ